jgi:hypothetical protein
VPYKNRVDQNANRRLKYRVQRDRLYDDLRVRPINPKDDTSPLACDACGKITGRDSAHVFRHHKWCRFYFRAQRILGYPRTYWSRKRTSYGVKRGVIEIDN